MKKGLIKNRGFIFLLIISFVLIVIAFLLAGSISIFPTPKDQEVKVYVDPDTGEESYYNPNYITEEEIIYGLESINHSHAPEDYFSENTETTPEP